MIKKFLYFFNKNQKKTLIVLFGFMLIVAALEMLGLGFIFTIVGALGDASTKSDLIINNLSTFLELNKVEIFSYLLIAFLLFYIIKTSFLMFYVWFEGNFLFSYREKLSSNIFRQYLNQDLNYFFNRNSSEFMRNLNMEANQFNIYLVQVLKFVLEIIVLLGILFVLFSINFYYTASISIFFILLCSLYFFLFKNKLNTWGLQRQKSDQKRIQFIQEGFDGFKIIKILGRENFFFNKFKYHNINLADVAIKTYFAGALPRLLFEFVGILLVTISMFFLYHSGKSLIDITQLVSVYIAASFRILPSITRIVVSIQFLKLNNPVVNLLYREINSFKKVVSQPEEIFFFNKKINIDIKKFIYPSVKNFEISDIKFNILKGQKIGIIGSSGSGKSTTVEILIGVLKPSAGDIMVDGKSIFSNLRGWQNLIGYVPQKIFILDESLRNNILFGLDSKKYNNNEILLLIKKLSLEKLLNRLPNGLDGNLGEKGINLSGGEIQRIGLCRALIYDPEILFLDEATSSLDIFTESQILNELEQFKEKTIISIAHRLNSLKNSDMIYTINNGTLTEGNTYEKIEI